MIFTFHVSRMMFYASRIIIMGNVNPNLVLAVISPIECISSPTTERKVPPGYTTLNYRFARSLRSRQTHLLLPALEDTFLSHFYKSSQSAQGLISRPGYFV